MCLLYENVTLTATHHVFQEQSLICRASVLRGVEIQFLVGAISLFDEQHVWFVVCHVIPLLCC